MGQSLLNFGSFIDERFKAVEAKVDDNGKAVKKELKKQDDRVKALETKIQTLMTKKQKEKQENEEKEEERRRAYAAPEDHMKGVKAPVQEQVKTAVAAALTGG